MTFSGKTPFIIGICGGSGAGKTTLLRRLSDIFGEVRPSIFSMDNYYFPKENKTACYADRWCFAVVDQAKNYESAETFLVYYSKLSLSKNFKKQHGVFSKIDKLKNPKILNIKEEVLLKNMSF